MLVRVKRVNTKEIEIELQLREKISLAQSASLGGARQGWRSKQVSKRNSFQEKLLLFHSL
jgi:hypothetical protein